MTIQEFLKESILITDGAMGTYYDFLYHGEDSVAEEANLTHPERILNIHKEYIRQGARLLRTNTFALNESTVNQLGLDMASSKEYITRNLKAAVRLARQAAEESGEQIFIGADIGPVPQQEEKWLEDEEYRRLIDLFLAEGVDIFILETFADMRPVGKMVSHIRKKKPDAFILVQFAVNPTGYSQMGYSAERLIREAGELKEIDGCGLNCSIGVSHMLRFIKQLDLPADKFISALPNCGYPHIVRGKTIYSDSVSYYAERMEKILNQGVNIIGGCCGTTPAYIGELTRRYGGRRPTRKKEMDLMATGRKKMTHQYPMIEKMNRGEKVIAVELDPPFNEDQTRFMEGAYYLKEKGIDMITIADSPMARSRADSFLSASKLIKDVEIPVIPHLTCRDRNRISIRSTILGGYANEIRNILVVTGDPIDRAEKEVTKGVFDFNSIRLMEFIQGMNEELFFREPICMGGALNQNGASVPAIASRMKKKIEAGASFFLTQPIYDEEGIEKIEKLKSRVETKILCGIMPLVSYRNAMFIRNEMPGIHVPEEVVNRYRPEMTRQEAEETAIELSLELIRKLDKVADGYYFMVPFNRVDLIGRIIEESRK